jgi:molybdate transport system ATP-binding protein
MLELAVRASLGGFTLDAELSTPEVGITALFGRSGSGKTSLLNMIAGLRRPEAGRIVAGGRVLFDSRAGINLPPERRRIGYIFQEGRLFPHLTVRGNLAYGMRLAPAAERYVGFDQVVALLGIADLLDRRPASLSGGEKQRVAIGRALLASPRLLLMDEPLAALDEPRKAEILPFIERLHGEIAVPIVYVSHAIDEALRLADTLAVMEAGRILAMGPVEEVTSRLDLAESAGFGDVGTVFAATVAHHDTALGISELATPAGAFRVGRLAAPEGATVRLRLRARDVALALAPPPGLSVLNVFAGTVAAIEPRGEGTVEVAVEVVPGVRLWSEVTRLACRNLDLAPGRAVHALIKSVAVERYPRG